MDNLLTIGLVALMLPVVGALVFRRISRDYTRFGQLTRTGTALQVGLFVLHGVSSLLFLNSRLSTIEARDPLSGFALLLITGGLVMLLSTIKRFGVKRAVGQEEPGSLVCVGMYQRSRNPQILFYGIAIVGYALLWPSWTGAIWVVLYAVLASMMVRVEEQHLRRTYGNDYVDYCVHTPRLIDLPRRK
jgi:protein-S-isoprenylcysteine O-methyltransferase Ste14